MNTKDELLKILSLKLRTIFGKLKIDFEKLQEIRLRMNAPLLIIYENVEYFITEEAKLVKNPTLAVIVTKNEIRETMEYISNYSLYAFEDEIKQGFITINGGHRIGIAGKTIIEDDVIKGMKHISFINIRLAHQVKGCADPVLPYLINEKTDGIYHTLIISPPRCGKTTLLRDIIRQLSDGNTYLSGKSIGVVDERSEIGACYMGTPQNELGIRTDILDCCPKAKGMMMLIRSMSPQIIAVDEIGSKEDLEAIDYVIGCGCKLIATVHGSSIEDIKSKPVLSELVQKKLFERYVLLSNVNGIGHLDEIYDTVGRKLYADHA
ncbi:stage III sporulation protein AA [Mobilitalea sibirica]|uniref:Stage III sporulation protein AA n=1 Tax=Mobilitalea sibirica TaxID=1462919 RepID=A0A8J7HAQ3_9FIRM|nr:stage III sporulation protein AA [Mobilitalea sibirica]MBH1940196.1 stage III sporulation protein AA [Mobilitalea sibirica]